MDTSQVSATDVRAQLERMLAGETALGRGEQFDPRSDPIARVEASRLSASAGNGQDGGPKRAPWPGVPARRATLLFYAAGTNDARGIYVGEIGTTTARRLPKTLPLKRGAVS